MNTIHLHTPLMVNDRPRHELTYDPMAITVSQFCEAEGHKFASSNGKVSMSTHECDHGMHLYLGMMAIIAVNPDIDIRDLERIKGYDLVQIVNIGRNFILRGAGAIASDQKQSESSSEPTPNITTPASETSDDNA